MKEIVRKVISRYFDEVDEGEDVLNKVIADVAKEEELNAEEISRVVEMSNVAVFEKLFDATKDKTLEFDLADTNKIIKSIEISRPTEAGFDDTVYEIPKELKKEDADGEVDVDLNEILEKARELFDRKDELTLSLFERKPKVKRIIKKKIQNNNPNSVIYAVKTAAPQVISELKEVCKEEKILEKEANISEEALLKTATSFLSDIKSYAIMKSDLEKVSADLEKISAVAKALSGGMKLMSGVSKANELKNRKGTLDRLINKGGDKSGNKNKNKNKQQPQYFQTGRRQQK